ncbi:unnamed protein product [Closterium sp. Yama58-4]|nr:unnamed protein product [Closterium sp. Yama58-4]
MTPIRNTMSPASHLLLLILLSAAAIHGASAGRASPLNGVLRPGFIRHRRPRGKPAPHGRNIYSVPSQLTKVLPHAAQTAADAMSALSGVTDGAASAAAGGGITTFAKPGGGGGGGGGGTTYFNVIEVTKPLARPAGSALCGSVTPLVDAPFASTYGSPPTAGNYAIPAACAGAWSMAVLNVSVRVSGVQFDRRMSVFIGNHEVSRSVTAEPLGTSVKYSFERDLTALSPAVRTNNVLSVYLENVVDRTYTGIFYVTASLLFYTGGPSPAPAASAIVPWFSPAVLSRYLNVTGGAVLSASAAVSGLPANAVRARFDLLVSAHANDEFYQFNYPNSATFQPEGGAFRELVLQIDGIFAGSVFPAPIFYTGAVNPLMWSPLVGNGNFLIPVYSFDVSPFAALLSDGNAHTITLAIPKAVSGSNWYFTGSLHLWTDAGVATTAGAAPTVTGGDLVTPITETATGASGTNGVFGTTAARDYTITGTVTTAAGAVQTVVTASLAFDATVTSANNQWVQVWRQNIVTAVTVTRSVPGDPATVASTVVERFNFPLFMNQTRLDAAGSVYFLTNNTFNYYQPADASPSAALQTYLHNERIAGFKETYSVTGAVKSRTIYSNHTYELDSYTGGGCYLRKVVAQPPTVGIQSDVVSTVC